MTFKRTLFHKHNEDVLLLLNLIFYHILYAEKQREMGNFFQSTYLTFLLQCYAVLHLYTGLKKCYMPNWTNSRKK